MTDKYINLFTDFGFKKIFGTEPNKDILIDFLNELLRGKEHIVNLTYLKTEHLGISELDRKAIFDLYCENEKGEKFIIELQKVAQKFFKDRSLYYSTFAIQEQASKGRDWHYELKAVYTIGIMDFIFDENQPEVKTQVQLMDVRTKKIFYEKLVFIYLEMPKFNKTEIELETRFDKWLFIIKNLHKLERIPSNIRENIFIKLFEQAAIEKYEKKYRLAYEDSLKYYRDLKNSMDTYYEQGLEAGMEMGLETGREQGEKQKALDMAQKMLAAGETITKITLYTNLSEAEINDLR